MKKLYDYVCLGELLFVKVAFISLVLLVFILFIVFLIMGMPIAFAIGISGTAFFLQYADSLPFTMTVQLAISQTQNFPLLAIPLFIFSANLMNETGLTQRLISLASVLTGHMRGGLAQVSVVLSAMMGGVSGSAIADAAMEARILGPDMVKDGYSKGSTASVLTIPSNITAIIPPSIGLILYGTIGEVSIGRLFAAGLPVGLLMVLALMAAVSLSSKQKGYLPKRKRASFKEIVTALTFARQLAVYGINVNGVAPHAIETDMSAEWSEEKKKAIVEAIPLKKLGQPEDVAEAVLFLASDKAGFITGEILDVNGGFLMD